MKTKVLTDFQICISVPLMILRNTFIFVEELNSTEDYKTVRRKARGRKDRTLEHDQTM